MNIQLSPHAYKQYKKFPSSLQLLLQSTISKLTNTPFPPGYKKLSGREGYRLRYGDYRIIYKINNSTKIITVESLAHRREIYK